MARAVVVGIVSLAVAMPVAVQPTPAPAYAPARLVIRIADSVAVGLTRQFMPGDAAQVFGSQLLALRLEQGRLAEVEGAVRELPDRFPAMPASRAALLLLHTEMGRLGEAREGIDALALDDFAALPKGMNWVANLAMLEEVCAVVGDGVRAARLYDLLAPCAPRTVVLGGLVCWGSVDRFLGILATTMEAWDAAARECRDDHGAPPPARGAAAGGGRGGSRPCLSPGPGRARVPGARPGHHPAGDRAGAAGCLRSIHVAPPRPEARG